MTRIPVFPADPNLLPEPATMTEAIAAKCQAEDELDAARAELARLRKVQQAWDDRRSFCLRKMYEFAAGKSVAT